MKITFTDPGLPKTGVIVVGILDGRKLGGSAKALDKIMNGGLVRAMKASRFKGICGHNLALLAPGGTKLDQILLVGLGKSTAIDANKMQNLVHFSVFSRRRIGRWERTRTKLRRKVVIICCF